MDAKLIYSLISGLFFITANLIYIKDIRSHNVIPQRATWLIYASLEIINFANQLASDAGYGAIPYAFTAAALAVVFLLSLTYGVGGINKLDLWVLGLALLGIGGWLVSGNPTISILASTIAIALASIPTVVKVINDPYSENYLSWSTTLAGIAFNIAALEVFTFATLVILATWTINNTLIIVIQLVLRQRSSSTNLRV